MGVEEVVDVLVAAAAEVVDVASLYHHVIVATPSSNVAKFSNKASLMSNPP